MLPIGNKCSRAHLHLRHIKPTLRWELTTNVMNGSPRQTMRTEPSGDRPTPKPEASLVLPEGFCCPETQQNSHARGAHGTTTSQTAKSKAHHQVLTCTTGQPSVLCLAVWSEWQCSVVPTCPLRMVEVPVHHRLASFQHQSQVKPAAFLPSSKPRPDHRVSLSGASHRQVPWCT